MPYLGSHLLYYIADFLNKLLKILSLTDETTSDLLLKIVLKFISWKTFKLSQAIRCFLSGNFINVRCSSAANFTLTHEESCSGVERTWCYGILAIVVTNCASNVTLVPKEHFSSFEKCF